MLFFFSSENVNLAHDNPVCYFTCERTPDDGVLWRVTSFIGTNFDTTESGLPELARLTDTLYSNLQLTDFLSLSRKIIATTPEIGRTILDHIESGESSMFVAPDTTYVSNINQLIVIEATDALEVTKFLMIDGLTKVFASTIPWNALLAFNMLLTRIHAWVAEGKVTITARSLSETNLISEELIQNLSLDSSINEDIKELLFQLPTLQIVDVDFDSLSTEEIAFLSEYMRLYQQLVSHYALFIDSIAVLRGSTDMEGLMTATTTALRQIKESALLLA